MSIQANKKLFTFIEYCLSRENPFSANIGIHSDFDFETLIMAKKYGFISLFGNMITYQCNRITLALNCSDLSLRFFRDVNMSENRKIPMRKLFLIKPHHKIELTKKEVVDIVKLYKRDIPKLYDLFCPIVHIQYHYNTSWQVVSSELEKYVSLRWADRIKEAYILRCK